MSQGSLGDLSETASQKGRQRAWHQGRCQWTGGTRCSYQTIHLPTEYPPPAPWFLSTEDRKEGGLGLPAAEETRESMRTGNSLAGAVQESPV